MLKRGNTRSVRLKQIDGSDVLIERACLKLVDQVRIRLRETMCCFESPCSVSPLRYSCNTCRLNSTLWVRCFAMGLHPLKARPPGQLLRAILSAPGGPLQIGVQF